MNKTRFFESLAWLDLRRALMIGGIGGFFIAIGTYILKLCPKSHFGNYVGVPLCIIGALGLVYFLAGLESLGGTGRGIILVCPHCNTEIPNRKIPYKSREYQCPRCSGWVTKT